MKSGLIHFSALAHCLEHPFVRLMLELVLEDISRIINMTKLILQRLQQVLKQLYEIKDPTEPLKCGTA